MVLKWAQGSTHTVQPFTLQTGAGTPLDLTGLTGSAITLKYSPISPIETYSALQGTATITSATQGQFNYLFATRDVAYSGNYQLVISVAFSSSDIWNSYPFTFIVVGTT